MAEPKKDNSKNDESEPAEPSSDDKAKSGTQETTGSKESSPQENKKRFFGLTVFQSIVAALMVLVNAGMLYYYYRLSQTTEEQVRIAEKSLNSSLLYGRRTVEIADSAMRIENRAYIVEVGIRWDSLEAGHHLIARFRFENSGKTPAFRAAGSAGLATDLKTYEQNMREAKDSLTNGSDLGTGKGIEFVPSLIIGGQPVIITKEVVEAIWTGKITIYVYGFVEYKDIFNDHHRTWYCGYSRPLSREFFAYEPLCGSY